MPTFTIQAPDGRHIDIQAADQATALSGAQQWVAANPKPAGPQLSGSAGYVSPPAQPATGLAGYVQQELNSGFVQPAKNLGHAVMQAYRDSAERAQHPDYNPLQMIPGVGQGQRDFLGMAGAAVNVPLAAVAAPVRALATRPTAEAISRLPVQAYDPTPTFGAPRALNQQQTEQTVEGALNTALQAVGPGRIGPMARIPQRVAAAVTSPEAALRAEGVSLTPGQRMGGFALAAEDKLQSAPILGDAIRGARMRGRQSLNRAVANRALAPIGETLPADVPVGTDAVAHVQSRLSAAYDHANSLITNVQPDEAFNNAIADIRGQLQGQPPSVLKRFDQLVSDRVLSRLNPGTTRGARLNAAPVVDGSTIQDIKSQLGELAADNLAGGGADRTLGRQLSAVADQVTALAGRTNPAYLKAQRAADAGWANFVRMRQAAGYSATDSGVFTPSQLKTAVRSADTSVGHGATARGDAPMSDLANNAASVMNQTIPNSGTTDRALWAGLGATAAGPGHLGIPLAAGLGVAAVPYLLVGRRIASAALRPGTSPEVLAAAAARLKTLSASEPGLVPLYRSVMGRVLDAAPVALSGSANAKFLSSRIAPGR